MGQYVVIVKLGEEAIGLEADNKEEALERARNVIDESYGEIVAEDSEYEVKEVDA